MNLHERRSLWPAIGENHRLQIGQIKPILEQRREVLTTGVDALGDEINLIAPILVNMDQFAGNPFRHAVFVEFIIHLRPELAEFALLLLSLEVLFPYRNSS